ncbi:hypothetical protein F5Y04DRAFT_286732 [Hypomontagnella monticulosa]|nr:hypothetical protein F5Y04DRAFT_286732 [Hypomontagnella monticulosa]
MEGIQDPQPQDPTLARTNQAPQPGQGVELSGETDCSASDSVSGSFDSTVNPTRRTLDEILRDISAGDLVTVSPHALNRLACSVLKVKDRALVDHISIWRPRGTILTCFQDIDSPNTTLVGGGGGGVFDVDTFSSLLSTALRNVDGDAGDELAQLNDKCNEYLKIEPDPQPKPGDIIELITNCIAICETIWDENRAFVLTATRSLLEDVDAKIWMHKIEQDWETSTILSAGVSEPPEHIRDWESQQVETHIMTLDLFRTLGECALNNRALDLQRWILGINETNVLERLACRSWQPAVID